MSYIGIATLLGRPIEIPIIIRSLADSMALVHDDDLPLNFDSGLLSTLDIGAHTNDNKSKIVGSYEHNWWTGRKARDLKNVQKLDASTVLSCLDHYKQQLSLSTPVVGSGSNYRAGAVAGAGDTNTPPHLPSVPAANPSTSYTGSEARSCQKCKMYKQLLSDVLLDTLKFRDKTSASTLLDLGIRKASAFHLLHEAAILKETAGIVHPAPASKKLQIAAVNKQAKSQLRQLQNLPPSSHKWSWGETLTEDDVLALSRTGT
jgi:hypothetical protein